MNVALWTMSPCRHRRSPCLSPSAGLMTAGGGFATIRHECDAHVGTLILSRPGRRNAVNPVPRVGMWETRFGLLPDMGATFRSPRLIGDGAARRMILTDRLRTAAIEFADLPAAQPAAAVTGARRAIEAGWHHVSATSVRIAVQAQADCLRPLRIQSGRPRRRANDSRTVIVESATEDSRRLENAV